MLGKGIDANELFQDNKLGIILFIIIVVVFYFVLINGVRAEKDTIAEVKNSPNAFPKAEFNQTMIAA